MATKTDKAPEKKQTKATAAPAAKAPLKAAAPAKAPVVAKPPKTAPKPKLSRADKVVQQIDIDLDDTVVAIKNGPSTVTFTFTEQTDIKPLIPQKKPDVQAELVNGNGELSFSEAQRRIMSAQTQVVESSGTVFEIPSHAEELKAFLSK